MTHARKKKSVSSRAGKQSTGKATNRRTSQRARSAPGHMTDQPEQALESGEPRLTGPHSVHLGGGASRKNNTDRAASKARQQPSMGKDSPQQAWESGRADAMP